MMEISYTFLVEQRGKDFGTAISKFLKKVSVWELTYSILTLILFKHLDVNFYLKKVCVLIFLIDVSDAKSAKWYFDAH